VSISSTFYTQLFCTKVFCAAFLLLQFGYVTFWHKNIGAKAAHKILIKLTIALKYNFLLPTAWKSGFKMILKTSSKIRPPPPECCIFFWMALSECPEQIKEKVRTHVKHKVVRSKRGRVVSSQIYHRTTSWNIIAFWKYDFYHRTAYSIKDKRLNLLNKA